MIARRITAACMSLCAVVALGCTENPPDTIIPQFDRPQDVALVCVDLNVTDADVESGLDRHLPLACCADEGAGVSGYCSGPNLDAVMIAFVTQTTMGEVAVVNVETQTIIDQDERVPLNSFIAVGSQPSDIAASWDGQMVYTANFETEDLSVIHVADSTGPTMVPATSIGLGGPAARMLIARAASIRDQYAFVTQPALGRVAVVQLPHDGAEGKLLAFLRMDRGTGIEFGPVDNSPEGVLPWAIVASEVRMANGDPENDQTFPSIYVAGREGNYVLELDSEVLVQKALELAEPDYLGDEAIVRRIELEEFSLRSMSVEPDLGRWIYGVENETGGVVVLDLTSGEILAINQDNPLADDAYSLDVPGQARAISLVRLAEDDEDTNPLTFNGTFGVVSTTQASVFILDVDDRNAFGIFPGSQHALRAGSDWYDEETEEYTVPEIAEEPTLEGDESILSGSGYPEFPDAGLELSEEDGPDGGPNYNDVGPYKCDLENEFRVNGEFGIRMRCDYRQSTNENWYLTWEGELGVSGAGVGRWDHELSDGEYLVIVDESKSFCSSGVLGSEDDPLGEFEDIYDGEPGLGNYRGDILQITSEATPSGVADCSEFDDENLTYRLVKLLDSHTVLLEPIHGSPAMTHNCFGQSFTYKLRANNHWVLKGGSTGYLRRGSTDEATEQCVPHASSDEEEERQRWKNFRVFEDQEFYNYYLKFKLESGTEDLDEFSELQYTFYAHNGFEPMWVVLGNDITDIEPAPDQTLVMVDRAGEGLMIFDMVEYFELIGSQIK